MKKNRTKAHFLSILLAFVMLMSALGGPCMAVNAASGFVDVKPGSWYYDSVMRVSELGIMSGTGNNKFEPNGTLTREQFVTMLGRFSGVDVSSYSAAQTPFNDVKVGSWYEKYVVWAYKNNITSGIDKCTFGVGSAVTREQMATFIDRYLTSQNITLASSETPVPKFTDEASISSWAKNAAEKLRVAGIFTGDTSHRFNPKKATTRAEAAKVFCNLVDAIEGSKIDTVNEPGLILYLEVQNGKVVDRVSGKVMDEIAVNGDYIGKGRVTLPSSYKNWTYSMVVDYNEESTKGVLGKMIFTSNSGKYEECEKVFFLSELDLISNRGQVKMPWVRDSWNSGYVIRLPIQLYAHISTEYEYYPTGDAFWSFSMDSDNGILNARIDGATASMEMSTYKASDGTTKYVDKIFPKTFTITGEHKVKYIKFYDRVQSIEEQEAAYLAENIEVPTSGINEVLDGITGLGSPFAFRKYADGTVEILETEKEAGTYTLTDENGRTTSYSIRDYVQPDPGIDNSEYESVHITNAPSTILVGKQYPLTALPYPFLILNETGKANAFDVVWKSSNDDVMTVTDGLLIAKNEGTVKITATLTGTNISDTVTIRVVESEKPAENAWYVPSSYKSANGNSFSDTDYEMTTRAIYDAIDEAAAKGYNHIIFPKQTFYAVPLLNASGYCYHYKVPSNITIEFPEGSIFRMMDNEVSRGPGNLYEIHYFDFGVASNDYENTCSDSHLIIDTYIGERYNAAYPDKDYLEENRFVNFGRKANNCSVEIKNAIYTGGYFIVADGTSPTNKKTGVMTYGDFVAGKLDNNGNLIADDLWISTKDFIVAPDYGNDGYFLAAHSWDKEVGKYWGGTSARLYNILWFNSAKQLIQVDEFQGRGEYYDMPDGAAFFKLSLHQKGLPTPASGETESSPWISLHDDGSAKWCEIKNTTVTNSAAGIFSVVGETDGFWVHDSVTLMNGKHPNDRTGDFENGWTAMRHSIVSNCFMNGYFGNPGGFNTFFHTNFIMNYNGSSGETEMLRYINCVTDYIDVSEKAQAHIFYNTVLNVRIDKFTTSLGHIYALANDTGKWVRSY